MAKQISQDTFDAVVHENMEEFEMEPQDAIDEAISQFEAQGVNLLNIVFDVSLYGGDGQIAMHPVVAAIESLGSLIASDPTDTEAILTSLHKIRDECAIDLAHRCLAGKHGAYDKLMETATKFEMDKPLLLATLSAMYAFHLGQPDPLTYTGLKFLCQLLKTYHNDTEVLTLVVRLIRTTCVMHETNRQDYTENDLIQLLADILETHKSYPELVWETCAALRVLTFDDDVRVPFGKGHDHAKIIVTEHGALKKLMGIAKEYTHNKAVLGELFATLSSLAVRNEFCQEIMDLGGLELLLNVLQKNVDHQGVTKQVLGLLKTIAGNDDVKDAIAKADGLEMIVDAVNKHCKHKGIAETGCAAIATVVLRKPEHCTRVMVAGGPEVIVRVLTLHPQEASVQKSACMALRNLVVRYRENCEPILALGAEELIKTAMMTHTSCHDEAKAALRDLECEVQLQERWKGEGRNLIHD